MAGENEVNPLELSDADFANLPMPSGSPIPAEPSAAPVVEEPVVEQAAAETPALEEELPDDELPAEPAKGEEAKAPLDGKAGETDPEGGAAQPEGEKEKEGTKGEKTAEGVVPPLGSDAKPVLPKKEGEAEGAATGESEPLNFAAIGEMVMKPFKANGQMIQLKTPEEAMKLMQMGAHFTRKMQAIQPHRKVLTMLENNGLLDEDRLSFLIDIEKKNPEAIKKLIKDAGINPLEIDTEVEPQYQGGSNKVTDAEVHFKTTLEDMTSTPEGTEALKHFNATWDDATKERVWAEPGLLATMNTQKQNGIYDRIEAEIERRRTLGTIGPETSFISAYQTVGMELHNAGALEDIAVKAAKVIPPNSEVPAAGQPALTPVATRAAAPKVPDNNDKAAAASPSRSGNRPAKPIVNPLAMSDEEFAALPLPVGNAR